MSIFDTAHSVATSAISEIVTNAESQTSYSSFITRQSAQLFDYASGEDKKHFKVELLRLLNTAAPDPTVVYRGLLIQLNGVFEGFIKSHVAAHVERVASAESTFKNLSAPLRTAYAAHSGRVLARIHDGSINGIAYNFDALQDSLGTCFSNISPFGLRGEVFTVLMGNCTPDRLEKLFEQVGLPHPFGDPIGKHKAIQGWSGESRARTAASLTRAELERQIEVRNDLVHGLATKVIVISDIQNAAKFFAALIEAYRDAATDLK